MKAGEALRNNDVDRYRRRFYSLCHSAATCFRAHRKEKTAADRSIGRPAKIRVSNRFRIRRRHLVRFCPSSSVRVRPFDPLCEAIRSEKSQVYRRPRRRVASQTP